MNVAQSYSLVTESVNRRFKEFIEFASLKEGNDDYSDWNKCLSDLKGKAENEKIDFRFLGYNLRLKSEIKPTQGWALLKTYVLDEEKYPVDKIQHWKLADIIVYPNQISFINKWNGEYSAQLPGLGAAYCARLFRIISDEEQKESDKLRFTEAVKN